MSDGDDDAIHSIRGPASGGLKSAVVACGGTGCNSLAEDVVTEVDRRIAVSSEPRFLEGFTDIEKVRVSVGRVERDARDTTRLSKLASNETEMKLGELVRGHDIVFILTGLGGETGGWTATLAAKAAHREKCPSFCVVSEPFSVESRAPAAKEQLKVLLEHADGVLVLPNDMILAEAPNLPIAKAFRVMNAVLASPINMISKNLGKGDLAALKESLRSSRIFSMDVATWEGENPTFSTVEQLGRSKWLALEERAPNSAIVMAEGPLVSDDLLQLGKEIRRIIGKDAKMMLAHTGSEGRGLSVTAIVGY
jgi:cell division protein FtsZ